MTVSRHPESIRPNPNGDWPAIDPTAYVDSTAQIIGRVEIGARVFVGPNAVIRADELGEDGQVSPIIVAAECNVQDGVVIHALAGTSVTIGQRTSVSHGAIIHGPCSLGEGCFVGFGATVFKANVADGVYIATRAVVEDADIPAGAFAPLSTGACSDQASRPRETTPREREFMHRVIQANLKLVAGYLGSASKLVR